MRGLGRPRVQAPRVFRKRFINRYLRIVCVIGLKMIVFDTINIEYQCQFIILFYYFLTILKYIYVAIYDQNRGFHGIQNTPTPSQKKNSSMKELYLCIILKG